jgi:catechol-2,3-dioxygenase
MFGPCEFMKIKSLKLWATQLDELAAFYRDTLGLIVSARQNRFEAYVGYTRLAFHQAETAEGGLYHFAINIPENQFDEGKAWLAQHVPLIQDRNGADTFDFLSWNAHACYCYDPAGNIVELIARHSLDCATTEPFSPRSLLGVSEMGLVTDDVRGSANQLSQKFGLGVYDGAGSDVFAAIGDEQGLFIVVKRGREWYPDTGKWATSSRFTLTFEQNGEVHSWEEHDKH